MYKEIILDALTGEETIIEYSEKELVEVQKKQIEHEAVIQKKLDEIAAKEAARQSALDKLAALGLSPEEISAITGS